MDVESSPGGLLRPSRSKAQRSRTGKRSDMYVGEAGFASSVVNLVNTIIGSGILAMPLALSRMGITLGTIVICWSGLVAGFGLYLQSRLARYIDRGSASFFALSQMTYPNASVIFDAAISVKCFGVGVSYLIIIGDLMPGVVKAFGFDTADFLIDRHFWITAFMLIVIPLSFLKRLDSLKYTSVVALTSIGYLIILILYHFLKGDTARDPSPIRLVTWQGIVPALSSFPVIVFGYTCHQNMFSILNEIADNSPSQTTSVIAASIGTAGFSYVLAAITGYLSFGNSISGNIVSMYPPALSSTIARAAIVVLVVFSVPLQVHPCRASVDAVLRWRPKSMLRNGTTSPSGSPHRHPLLPSRPQASNDARQAGGMSDSRFAVLTTIILILAFIAAMSISSLEAVLAYVGSTGSTAISFILPGLFYYKISDPDSFHHQRLMKEDDDEAGMESGSDDEHGAPYGTDAAPRRRSASEILSSPCLGANRHVLSRKWRHAVLRKMSLALAVYGFIVMGTCLTINTFFVASH